MSKRPQGPASVCLRLAAVFEGRVLEERIVTSNLGLRGGQLSEEGPHEITFRIAGSQVLIEGALKGRVQEDGNVSAIRTDRLTLGLHAQGRLEHAQGILLFQVIEPLPARRAPGLPAAMRGGAAIDRRFTAIATASLLAHFAFVVLLENIDPPYVSASALPTHVVELLMDAPSPPPVAPIEPNVEPNVEEVAEPTEVAESESTERPTHEGESATHPRGPRGPSHSGPEAPDSARLFAELAASLNAAPIGSLGGSMASGPSAGSIMASAAEGTASGTASSTLATRGGGGTVNSDDLGHLATVAGGGTAVGEGHTLEATGPVGTIRPETPIEEPGPGLFDVRRVTSALRARMAAMRRCYERELRDDPTLRGSLDISFSIRMTGELTNVRVTDDSIHSARLGECVVRTVRSIPRFSPGPEGGEARFTYPLVFEHTD